MATQNNNQRREREYKFYLSKWFTDADRVVEPEEKKKVVVAGMVEASPDKKDYPDTYMRRIFAVLAGETSTMFKTAFWFIIISVLFIVGIVAGDYFLQKELLGGTYNFMASIGVGYPGTGDDIAQSVATLYQDVKFYVILIGAGACIIASPFVAGLMYTAKRVFFQDTYKSHVRIFFHGFAKHWWKYLVCGTIATGILIGIGKAILDLLSAQQLGNADALDYCLAIIPTVLSFPIFLLLFTMMGLFVTHDLKFGELIKNAIVIMANNLVVIPALGILTFVPLIGFFCMGSMMTMMTYLIMVLAGFFLLALMWVAVVDRGMVKCRIMKKDAEKKAISDARRGQKQFQDQYAHAQKKKPQQKQQFQNPKKKKKK